MQISSISNRMPVFKAQRPNHPALINLEGKKDDEVVSYGTWGPNYVYPITAGQLRAQIQEQLEREKNTIAEEDKTSYENTIDETYEEYYKRKINSPEWGAY